MERLQLTCQDVVEFATIEGPRRRAGLGHGQPDPGKDADVIVLRTDTLSLSPMNNPAGAVVYAAHPGNVGTIFVAGRCVKRDGVLVDVDIAGVLDRAIKSRDELRAKGDIRIGGDWIPEATRPDEAA